MVPWSKGKDTALSRLGYSVQVRWGSLWLLSLNGCVTSGGGRATHSEDAKRRRTPASQAGDVGFETRRSYHGWVCLEARARVCKTPTLETPQVQFLLHPLKYAVVAEW